jgi:5-methylcytosine-specific restriction enzyme subunit McrC
MAVYKNNELIYILDTKWKLIYEKQTYDNDIEDNKKGISQSDMYQLFAYGKKYQVNKVVLIYPKWDNFNDSFNFKLDDDDLTLEVCPFELGSEDKNSLGALINSITLSTINT